MGESSILINLILLVVAVGVFLKLRSVLGRRTGHERPPFDPYSASEKPARADDKVVSLPQRGRADTDDSGIDAYPQREPYVVKNRWEGIAPEGSPLAQTLTEIALADRRFDAEAFLSGARIAYEMIVNGFAKGDRKALQPLLDENVYKSFEGVIAGREARGEQVEQNFIGITKSQISGAALEGKRARLTINFTSELTACTKNKDGIVIEGDPVTIRQVNDVWTFERDLKASDPNWRLVATGAAD
ncbi:Tim44/TimA family putative adaptor protein [Parvibaculum sedimenti]|uniref:Tim44/TimA family putative adaptor protein n=1 Tax=Parvibaculum sedimenti TaxID=2608632 RepID=A0A6N6VCS8_9HYPH|nr:Tim44/TimA family putative adaptor protein [Parvibaculum sedimenti]KAB7738486.1 Tim44/TimA family putative adaptor protein [Parvibaculum sedimenti]